MISQGVHIASQSVLPRFDDFENTHNNCFTIEIAATATAAAQLPGFIVDRLAWNAPIRFRLKWNVCRIYTRIIWIGVRIWRSFSGEINLIQTGWFHRWRRILHWWRDVPEWWRHSWRGKSGWRRHRWNWFLHSRWRRNFSNRFCHNFSEFWDWCNRWKTPFSASLRWTGRDTSSFR